MVAQAEKINVEKIIDKAVKKAVSTSFMMGVAKGRQEAGEAKNLYKQTEIRLYAYPELKRNIQKYNDDIADLRQEGGGGRSKDIVFFSSHGGGTRLSADEIMEARIMIVQKKIFRDQTEIDEIDYALQSIAADEYYSAVEMKYFEEKSDDEIGEAMNCDASTVRRNKSRLIRRLAVKLYGALAVG